MEIKMLCRLQTWQKHIRHRLQTDMSIITLAKWPLLSHDCKCFSWLEIKKKYFQGYLRKNRTQSVMITELLLKDVNMYSVTELWMHLGRETLLPWYSEGIVKSKWSDLKKTLNGSLLCVLSIMSMERGTSFTIIPLHAASIIRKLLCERLWFGLENTQQSFWTL